MHKLAPERPAALTDPDIQFFKGGVPAFSQNQEVFFRISLIGKFKGSGNYSTELGEGAR